MNHPLHPINDFIIYPGQPGKATIALGMPWFLNHSRHGRSLESPNLLYSPDK